jgi:predicted ATPase
MDAEPASCQGDVVGAERPGDTAGGELLERAHHLSTLGEALAAARGDRGVLVLLAGEAGGGKTALLRRFCATCEPVERVLWGSCDPLFTPRPLGPFLDIAEEAGGELRDLVSAGAKPYQIAAAVVRAAQSSRGTILILEDLHWGRRGDARRAESAGSPDRGDPRPRDRDLP